MTILEITVALLLMCALVLFHVIIRRRIERRILDHTLQDNFLVNKKIVEKFKDHLEKIIAHRKGNVVEIILESEQHIAVFIDGQAAMTMPYEMINNILVSIDGIKSDHNLSFIISRKRTQRIDGPAPVPVL